MTELRVRIGRLSFDGFELDQTDARAIRRAAEAELGRLLADTPIPVAPRAVTSPNEPLTAGSWRTPQELGIQVAQALHRGLGGSSR